MSDFGRNMPGYQQPSRDDSPHFLNTFQNPELINLGLSAGQDMLNKQKDRLMPGVSILWNSLKIYFAVTLVSNKYVIKKISIILYPISNKKWTRMTLEDVNTVGDTLVETTNHKYALPRYDINAPDLYIPLMSFITYVLLIGYVKGTSNKFTPEALIHTVWICVMFQCIETAAIKLGLNIMQVTLPVLDVFAYTGYKYISLCVNTATLGFGKTVYAICTLYTSLMLAYFFLKSLAGVVPVNVNSVGPPRHLMLLTFALMQLVVAAILSLT